MKQHKNRYLVVGALGAALAVLLAVSMACAAEETPTPAPTAAPVPTTAPAPTVAPASTVAPTGQPVYGGTLRYVAAPLFKTMDPVFAVGDPITLVHYLTMNQLVKLGTNMDIQPELAESWTVSSDSKAVTLHLRRGVKFQDGTLFTAQAVKWNLDRCLDIEVACVSKSKIEQIDRVTVEDDYTVTIHLKNPYRPILAALAEIAGFMSSPTAIEKYDSYDKPMGDYGRNPTGTGPFKLEVWIPDLRLELVKNENYWESGKPYLDKIVFFAIPEGGSGLAMLRTNETDIMEISPRDLPLLKDNPLVKTGKYESGRAYNFTLNLTKPPLDNLALREAMAYGMDRQTFIDIMFEGEGRPAYTIIGQGWAYDPAMRPFEYNPQKAKEKLVEAGYPNGVTVELMCRTTGIWPGVCEGMQAMMEPVDINVTIDLASGADYSPRRLEREYQFMPSYRTPLGDPHLLISELFQKDGRGNYNDYDNPEVNAILLQAGAEFDLAKANKLYNKAQLMIAEDVPMILYMYSYEYVGMNKKVQNFLRTPDLDLKLRDLWLEK